jgi:arylsulfatase A-like enzyme
MLFTDYYAEASCTAGRANFITGELPIRTGLTTVGQAGVDVGIPAQAVTLATILKELGYETAQFGKNHLGDLNKYLPTLYGFDEYFATSTISMPCQTRTGSITPGIGSTSTARANLIHSWATEVDDPTGRQHWLNPSGVPEPP